MLSLSMLVGLVMFSPASAQQTRQPPQKLTLADAMDLAEKQNLDLAAARAQRAVAEAGVRAAGERPNPTLSSAPRGMRRMKTF